MYHGMIVVYCIYNFVLFLFPIFLYICLFVSFLEYYMYVLCNLGILCINIVVRGYPRSILNNQFMYLNCVCLFFEINIEQSTHVFELYVYSLKLC